VGSLDVSARSGRSNDVSVLESANANRFDSAIDFGRLAVVDGVSMFIQALFATNRIVKFVQKKIAIMTTTEKTYQSILQRLSTIPVEHLELVDEFLAQISQNRQAKDERRQAILNLAGSWSDMSEKDYDEFRRETKEVGAELFNREVEL
jgi:hypothetical protein